MSRLAVFFCLVFCATAVCGIRFHDLPQRWQMIIAIRIVEVGKFRVELMNYHQDMWDRAWKTIIRINKTENEACKKVYTTLKESEVVLKRGKSDDTSNCVQLAYNASSLKLNIGKDVSKGIKNNMEPALSSKAKLKSSGDQLYNSNFGLREEIEAYVANMTAESSFDDLFDRLGAIVRKAKSDSDRLAPPAMAEMKKEVNFLENTTLSPYCSKSTELRTALNAYSAVIKDLKECMERKDVTAAP